MTPLPGMPLGRATSHLSPGEPVCMRPTQWTKREASEYSQGREHLPPSAVEKLCGDKSRAECHCACVVCPNPQPRTQSQNSAGSRKDPSLLFSFLLGSVKDVPYSAEYNNFNHPATLLSCVDNAMLEKSGPKLNCIQLFLLL